MKDLLAVIAKGLVDDPDSVSVEADAPNEIREGDRKIIVQIVTNMDYWNYIP